MKLHPAPYIKDVDYIWYSSRIEALIKARSQDNLYSLLDGWLDGSQDCFKWLATVPTQKIEFRIIRWKGGTGCGPRPKARETESK